MDESLIACMVIKPTSNGFHFRTIRENGQHKDVIVWSTKALFLMLAELCGFDLSKQNFSVTHNGEDGQE